MFPHVQYVSFPSPADYCTRFGQRYVKNSETRIHSERLEQTFSKTRLRRETTFQSHFALPLHPSGLQLTQSDRIPTSYVQSSALTVRQVPDPKSLLPGLPPPPPPPNQNKKTTTTKQNKNNNKHHHPSVRGINSPGTQ